MEENSKQIISKLGEKYGRKIDIDEAPAIDVDEKILNVRNEGIRATNVGKYIVKKFESILKSFWE